jgi:hypothetical protein
MTDITVTFVGNIANEDGQRTIIGNIKNMLLDTLYVRTYFWSIVNGKPYKDAYEQSDARMYFQCALTCALQQNWDEALSWYTMGSRAFTLGATLFDRSSDIQCDYDHDGWQYDVSVQTWFNTMYGSKQELYIVGHLRVHCLDRCDMTGHDVTDRMSVLRDEWFEVVAAERKQIEANEAAIKEFRKSFEYDN